MAPRDRQRLQPRNEGLGVTVNLPYGRGPTEIQSGGPGGEFGGSQRLYTGRNPFITPNDPGMDFGVPGPPRPEEAPWDRPFRPIPGPRPPGGVGPRPSPRGPGSGWDRPFRPIPGGDYLAGNFGGGLGDQFARNEGAMGMLDEAGLGSFDGDSETAGLYQTWKKIKAMIGETEANEWLEAQQTV